MWHISIKRKLRACTKTQKFYIVYIAHKNKKITSYRRSYVQKITLVNKLNTVKRC
jgi:hypothetical protein